MDKAKTLFRSEIKPALLASPFPGVSGGHMYITHKKGLPNLELDTRVPDETLNRDTKPRLSDDSRADRKDSKRAADAAFGERLKHDMKRS